MDLVRPLILALALVSLAGGCSKETPDQTPVNTGPLLIEPNIAVGPIRAGMTTQQVVAALGPAQRRSANALEYTRLGLAVIPNSNGVVQVVMAGDVTGVGGPLVKAFTGRTREGIGMNSTRQELVRALGEPSSNQRFPGGLESISYANLGLTLTLEAGKVHHMIVRFPDSANPDRSVNLAPPPP